MKFIIGKKVDMTQIWQGDNLAAVTRVKVGPCVLTQVKNGKTDGYFAAQVGFGQRKAKNIAKPQKGHFKNLGNFENVREFRLDQAEIENLKRGDMIDINTFQAGDKIQVTSISKGKGFQGVVKRHGFSGSKKTHGNKDQLRMPGSAGATGPAHVFKGMRMGGRMGGEIVTTKNLQIAEVDAENSMLLIRGAVSGARNSLVLISGLGDLVIKSAAENAEPSVMEEAAQEASAEAGEAADQEAKKPEAEASVPETPEEVEKEVVEAKEKLENKES